MPLIDVPPGVAEPTAGQALDGGTDSIASKGDWLAGRRITRSDLLVAVLIGLAIVAIGYVFRSPLVPTDPWHYVRSAMQFPSDDWVPLGYTRYGMIFLTAPFALIFRNSEASYYAVPLLSAGMLGATLYLLGRRWWGWVAGALAVVLFFANSIVFLNLSRGYPDVPSMALIMFAALLALVARDRGFRGKGAVVCLLLVGFALGMSFETRETSMLAWPMVVAILWQRGRVVRNAAIVLVPLLAWAAVDVGVSALAYGDPLLKVHTLMGVRVGEARAESGELAATNVVGMPRWWYLLQIPRTAWLQPDGLWMLVAGAVAVLGLFVRNKPARLMAASFVSVYLLNVAAGGGLDPQHPKGKLDIIRYWIQYFPAMYLTVGAVVALLGGWLARRWMGARAAAEPTSSAQAPRRARRGLRSALPAVVLAVLASAGPLVFVAGYATDHPAFAPNGGEALEELRDHVRGQKFGEVWTDWETKRILPAYQRDFFGGAKVWSGTPMSLTGAGEPGPGDLVLLYSARSSTCGHCRTALGPWLEAHPNPPSSWRVLYETRESNLTLYQVP
jgi:hypothetical protein